VAVCLGGFSHCHRVYFLHLLRPLMAGACYYFYVYRTR
jgi:hypothetical protein